MGRENIGKSQKVGFSSLEHMGKQTRCILLSSVLMDGDRYAAYRRVAVADGSLLVARAIAVFQTLEILRP